MPTKHKKTLIPVVVQGKQIEDVVHTLLQAQLFHPGYDSYFFVCRVVDDWYAENKLEFFVLASNAGRKKPRAKAKRVA